MESKNRRECHVCESYIDNETNTATLIEELDNAESFKEIATKAIGTPVNLKFREITTFENMTILGDVSDEMKENTPIPIINTTMGATIILRFIGLIWI